MSLEPSQAPQLPITARYAPPVPITSGSAPRRFFRGLIYPWRGLRLLVTHTELWPWAAAPFFITVWSLLGALWVVVRWTDDLVTLILPAPVVTDGMSMVALFLWNILVVLLILAFFVIATVIALVAGNIIASPFYDVMAQKVERLVLGTVDEEFNWRVVLGDAWMSIRHSALSLLIFAFIMGPLFLLNLIPVAGSALYTVLSTIATIFFLAREMMDIPLSRRRVPYRAKLGFIRQSKALLSGLGAASMAMLAIPGLNLVVMPVAVLGGTLMYCHLDGEGRGVKGKREDAFRKGLSTPS